MAYDEFFVRDPGICGGDTVLKGTRVTLRTVLASLAEGLSLLVILSVAGAVTAAVEKPRRAARQTPTKTSVPPSSFALKSFVTSNTSLASIKQRMDIVAHHFALKLPDEPVS